MRHTGATDAQTQVALWSDLPDRGASDVATFSDPAGPDVSVSFLRETALAAPRRGATIDESEQGEAKK